MSRRCKTFAVVLGVSLALASSACLREKREFPQDSTLSQSVVLSELHPGGGATPSAPVIADERNAYSLSEGKTLYQSYNCIGCHSNGGGGMGPPLMDDQWIYGYEIDQVYRSILEGRPNGMPTWRNKISDRQIWQLAAYVRAMSGQIPKDAAPGRDDHMSGKPPESNTWKEHPTNSTVPPAAVQ
jgi:cytochrome c oxidase cbb3-type subunit 3